MAQMFCCVKSEFGADGGCWHAQAKDLGGGTGQVRWALELKARGEEGISGGGSRVPATGNSYAWDCDLAQAARLCYTQLVPRC